MKANCPHTYEVEAALDGRLGQDMAILLDRHGAGCAECARERASLEALSRRCQKPAASAGDLLVLRGVRARLLEKAAVAGPRRERRPLMLALTAVCSLGLVAALAMYWLGASQLAQPRSTVTVVAETGADWARSWQDGHEQIVLREGRLTVSINHGSEPLSLRVSVPDGEIEDVGTTFSIAVEAGRTRAIRVSEGAVVFHRHEGSMLRFEAPASWIAPPLARKVVPAPAPAPAEPQSHGSRAPAPLGQHPNLRIRSESAAPPAVPEVADEDLAYLHIIALLREQRSDEARLAARRYLEVFPGGLRRKEVQEIAR
jgi:hypothetical protein